MKSIRLSLMVYFLILLALGLGPISLLSYRRAKSVLEERASTRQELLRVRHDEACKKEREKLDNLLLNQAWYLAGHAQLNYPDAADDQLRFDILAPLASLNAPISPVSCLALPVWYADLGPYERGERGLALAVPSFRFRFPHIEVDENLLPKDEAQEVDGYFQINTLLTLRPGSQRKRPVAWRSRAMEDDTFAFDEESLPRQN